jgi:hypothetical protein
VRAAKGALDVASRTLWRKVQRREVLAGLGMAMGIAGYDSARGRVWRHLEGGQDTNSVNAAKQVA